MVSSADTSAGSGVAAADAGTRLIHCTAAAELQLPASRALIGSLIRPFLDQLVITPTELVFSGRHQTRLESAGTLMNEAIEKAAAVQARALNIAGVQRMRELQTLVGQFAFNTKEVERNDPLPALKPGAFGAVVAHFKTTHSGDALTIRTFRILAETLSGARVWTEKIELALALAREALGCGEASYLDALLGEIVQSEVAQDMLFGRMVNVETRIDSLIALFKGSYDGDQYTSPGKSALEFNKLMGEAEWPETRAAIETAIVQHLASKLPIRSPELLIELKALHGMLGKLRESNRTIGGRRALEFIDKRMGRLLSAEAITDHIRDAGSMPERMISLIELYSVTFGPANRKLVGDFITRYFTDEDFERRLVAGEGAPQHKLAFLTRLYRVILTSTLSPDEKQSYAKRLARIQTNFLDSSKLFAAIDKQHTNSARKCQHVAMLCAEGCFIPGENLDRAKALIRHYMAKPDFMEKLHEGQGRAETMAQFKAHLAKLNIPAPFDA